MIAGLSGTPWRTSWKAATDRKAAINAEIPLETDGPSATRYQRKTVGREEEIQKTGLELNSSQNL